MNATLQLSTFTFCLHQGRLRQHWKPFVSVGLHARWPDVASGL